MSAFYMKNLAQPWQTMFKKKDVIKHSRFTKLIIADLIKKFPSIPQRLEEDYHSIKDEISLEYKEYEKVFVRTPEDHSNTIQALNVDSLKVDLVVTQNTCSEKEDSNLENASSKSVKEYSLDSATRDVHAIKYKMSKAKERCMAYFQSLHSHLQVLSKEDLKGTRIEHGFKRAFMSLFGQDADTFTCMVLLNYDRRVNKRQMKTQESKIDSSKAVDADLVVTESSGTESEFQDDSSRIESGSHKETPKIVDVENAKEKKDEKKDDDNCEVLTLWIFNSCTSIRAALLISSLNSTVLILTWQHQLDLAALIYLGSINQQHQSGLAALSLSPTALNT
nr:hypothetical protein [Tanacetum cinerariifolium]